MPTEVQKDKKPNKKGFGCLVGLGILLALPFVLVGVSFLCFVIYDTTHPNLILASLPEPIETVCYTDGGFQDYTDYEKRSYTEEALSFLENNAYFQKVNTADISEITAYFKDFSRWINMTDYADKYDFDIDCISETDYFYIEDKCFEKENSDGRLQYEQYKNYNVYFFDTESLTLYFIHNNI